MRFSKKGRTGVLVKIQAKHDGAGGLMSVWLVSFLKLVLIFFKLTTSEHFSVWACLLALEHYWYCWCEEQHKRDVLLLDVTQTRAQTVSLWLLPSWYIVFQCTIVVYIVLYVHLYRYRICFVCFAFFPSFWIVSPVSWIKQLDDFTQPRNLLFACLITFQPNNNKDIPWNDVGTVYGLLYYREVMNVSILYLRMLFANGPHQFVLVAGLYLVIK